MKKYLTLILAITVFSTNSYSQDQGVLSGNFQSNFSVFIKDSLIGATEAASPQYGKQITSAEAWLFLNYDIKGFHFSGRYDLFNNSNLLNPSGAFTGQGLGFWQIKKSIGNLEITAGSFYDQFGSGAAFRAFENRLIGIDYAMEGVRLKYDISDDFIVKAFTGKQKGSQDNRFETSPQIIKGINVEKGFASEDGTILNVGVSAVNRTLDENTMSQLVTEINGLPKEERFFPKYNVYVMNGYFSLAYKDFGFNGEYNYKTGEAIRDNLGGLYSSEGSLILGGASYSKRKIGAKKKGGIGINVQYRRIENFPFTVSPYVNLLNGIVTYQPSMSRQASYRMLARYQAPAQFTGEQAYQAELIYSFNKATNITLNYSDITDLSGEQLFNEKFVQVEHKINKKWKGKVGLQVVTYNQPVYEGKDAKVIDNVETLTPFFEVTYKVNRKNSIRLESQMLNTEQDLGSFYHGILEWNSSPRFSVALSDMINTNPVRKVNPSLADQVLHYPSVFLKYNVKTTSFTAAYVKQVEGINCTGGICRLEPAFSGLRFTIATQF
ncbi:MAG: hypothetical protein COA58_07705 [Bacteroidetes bacterium]|nr:MAG: hypothetical protein COA58_07705 [Bacteroidota bacterium]